MSEKISYHCGGRGAGGGGAGGGGAGGGGGASALKKEIAAQDKEVTMRKNHMLTVSSGGKSAARKAYNQEYKKLQKMRDKHFSLTGTEASVTNP